MNHTHTNFECFCAFICVGKDDHPHIIAFVWVPNCFFCLLYLDCELLLNGKCLKHRKK